MIITDQNAVLTVDTQQQMRKEWAGKAVEKAYTSQQRWRAAVFMSSSN